MARRLPVLVVLIVVGVALFVVTRERPAVTSVSGVLESDEIRIGSRVGGRVKAVHVREGDAVQAGQVLVELEPLELEESEKRADAVLAAARADLARLENGYRPEERAAATASRDRGKARLDELRAGARPLEIEAARRQLELAEAEQKLATLDQDRATALFRRDAASQEALDQAQSRSAAAAARTAVRRSELALLEQGTRPEVIAQAEAALAEAQALVDLREAGSRREDVDAARARVAEALAELAAVRRRLDELAVRSPIAGRIEAIRLRPGDIVGPDAPILSLIDPQDLWVRAFVPESRMALDRERPLEVRFDAIPDRVFAGKVVFVAREGEFIPGNVQTIEERSKQVFRIKVALEPDPALRPGMIGNVELGAEARP